MAADEEPPIAAAAKRELRGRVAKIDGMPDDFFKLLGNYQEPEEAREIEQVLTGLNEFSDLPESKKQLLYAAAKSLCQRCQVGMTPQRLNSEYHKASRSSALGNTVRKSELIGAYRYLVRTGEVAVNLAVEELLMKKKGKSHSGVLVVTSFFGPGAFSCPKDCHYCPNQPGIARSYLLREPGVLRGYRNNWDPIHQFYDRANALENNGHIVDKIELILLGGTFSFYPHDYARDFIRATFYAANTYYSAPPLPAMRSLDEELTLNETARCRIIGVTIETRPDYISYRELVRFRSLGVTRVQLGIQHTDDEVLDAVNRECPTEKAVVGIRRLLDAGFKVDAHWMPDLPGSSYDRDMEMFRFLLSPANEDFQVDQWKVYPTAVVPFTKIKSWYDAGQYKPYAEEEGGRKMADLITFILEHCPYRLRLNRIVRDIPGNYICGGENRVNLRQVLDAEMLRRGSRCRDIRERECKGQAVAREHAATFIDRFRASVGTEFYVSVENVQRTVLFGHLRLRLRDRSAATSEADGAFPVLKGAALIRELHTYGKLVAVSQTLAGDSSAGAPTTATGSTAGSGAPRGATTQHTGVGGHLMLVAERLALENGFSTVAVIAGVGVRPYYARLGYDLRDTYMVKDLPKPSLWQRLSGLLTGGDVASAS